MLKLWGISGIDDLFIIKSNEWIRGLPVLSLSLSLSPLCQMFSKLTQKQMWE